VIGDENGVQHERYADENPRVVDALAALFGEIKTNHTEDEA